MLMADEKGRIVWVNAQIETLFGYDRTELIGQSLDILIPDRYRATHPKFRAEFFREPATRPMGAGRDLTGVRKDGLEVPVEVGLNPLTTPAGRFVLSSVVDITERKRAHEILETQRNDLERTNREREVLLKEIYHRVKNNLQVISSLLNLQDEHISDPRSLALLQESKNRIHAIGLVHEQLYQSTDLARIDFAVYVHELIDHLMSVFRPALIHVEVEVADVHLPLNVAVPAGLIINELVTNSLKHAFPQNGSGRIVVRLSETQPGSVSMIVEDDGQGIPAHIEWGSGNSLGLELVAKLCKQLRGQVGLDRTAGTKVHLTFDYAG